ncbi:MAG: hypothetical protein ACSHXY_04755 [Alphaproteobacteria bacterium]
MIAPEGYVPISLLWDKADYSLDVIGKARNADNFCEYDTVPDCLSNLLCRFAEHEIFVTSKTGDVFRIQSWPLLARYSNRVRWFVPAWEPKVRVEQGLRFKFNVSEDLTLDERERMSIVNSGSASEEQIRNSKPIMNERSGFFKPFLFLEFSSFRINFDLFDCLKNGEEVFHDEVECFANEFRHLSGYYLCIKEKSLKLWDDFLQLYCDKLEEQGHHVFDVGRKHSELDFDTSDIRGPGAPSKLGLFISATERIYPNGVPAEISNYGLSRNLKDIGFDISERSISRYRKKKVDNFVRQK